MVDPGLKGPRPAPLLVTQNSLVDRSPPGDVASPYDVTTPTSGANLCLAKIDKPNVQYSLAHLRTCALPGSAFLGQDDLPSVKHSGGGLRGKSPLGDSCRFR